jgi:hypothetical protein
MTNKEKVRRGASNGTAMGRRSFKGDSSMKPAGNILGTNKEKVHHFWPEAWSMWSAQIQCWVIMRHSDWGPHRIGVGNSARAAWADAAKGL